MFEPQRQLVIDNVRCLDITSEARCRTIEVDLIFGLKPLLVETGIAELDGRLAERPFLFDLGVDRIADLANIRDIGIVRQQIARHGRTHRTIDGGRAVVFKAALVLDAVGTHVETGQGDVRRLAIDLIARVEAVIVAVAGVGLVLAVDEVCRCEIRRVLGRIRIAEARLELRIVAPLHIGAEQQAARPDLTAPHRTEARLELAVVIVEPTEADIAAIELEPVAQHDVERAGDRIARAARGGGAHNLYAAQQFGRDTVEEKTAVGVGAGDALAVDQDLRIARRQAAQPRAIGFDHVREEGDGGDALQGIAGGQRFETLEIFCVVYQHRLGRFSPVAEPDLALDDDVLRCLQFAVLIDHAAAFRILCGGRHGGERQQCAASKQRQALCARRERTEIGHSGVPLDSRPFRTALQGPLGGERDSAMTAR